jgi:hypothetical protein
LRAFDYLVTLIAVALTSASAFFIYGSGGEALFVTVSAGESGAQWVHPLSATESFAVDGPLGETIVEIKDGAARVISSPCENQMCVAAGAARSEGAFVACLPNRVILTVNGRGRRREGGRHSETGEVDAATW